MSAEFNSPLDYSSSPATGGCPTVLQLISRLDGGGSGRIAIELSSTVSEAGGRALIAYDGEAATYELTRYGITPVEEKLTSRNPTTGAHLRAPSATLRGPASGRPITAMRSTPASRNSDSAPSA